MDVCCTTSEGGAKWNRMVVDAKGGGKDRTFNFYSDIINHLPLKSTSRGQISQGLIFAQWHCKILLYHQSSMLCIPFLQTF